MKNSFNTLWELTDAAEEHYNITVPTIYGGIPKEQTLRIDVKPARGAYVHLIIYRLPSGRYELVHYQL